MMLCDCKHQNVVQLLLDHPASQRIGFNARISDIESWPGFSATSPQITVECLIRQACRNGHQDVVKLLLDHSISDTCNFNAKEAYSLGETLLEAICSSKHPDVIKMVLDHLQERRTTHFKNVVQTVFVAACKKGRKDTIKLLMDYTEIDINFKDNNGRTALQYAQERNDKTLIKVLQGKRRF